MNMNDKGTVLLFESTRPYNPTVGGSIRSLRVVAGALSASGWRVIIVSYMKHPLLEFHSDKNIQNIVLRYFGLRSMLLFRRRVESTTMTKALHHRAQRRSASGSLRSVVSTISSPIFLLLNSLNIYRLNISLRADLLYTNTGLQTDRAAIVGSLFSSAKLICHLRNLPKFSFFDRVLARRADALISISQAVYDHHKYQKIGNSKSIVLLNALGKDFDAISQINVAPKLGQSDPLHFGCFSRLIHWKGLVTLLRAFRTYLDKGGRGELSIFGDGPDLATLLEHCAKLDLTQKIVFHGHVDKVIDAYRSCDVVVAPSDTPEPLGRTVMEAKCLGIAVIASRGGGYLETVTHDVDGLLFDMGSSEGLADAMLSMYGDKQLRSRLVAAGLRQSKQWSVDQYARNLNTFVNEVVT